MLLLVSSYDHIVLPDQYGPLAGQSIRQYIVSGNFGAGMVIIVKQNGQEVRFTCTAADNADTVAAKIVAAWNKIYPSDFNTVGFRNDLVNVANAIPESHPNYIQLFTPSMEAFVFEYEQPTVTTTAATETPTPTKNNPWLWIGGGGLLLLLLARKKKKKKA